MKVQKHTVVTMDYLLKVDGQVIEDSLDRNKPLRLVMGCGKMPIGFEEAITGLEIGTEKEFTVPKEKGFSSMKTLLEVARQRIPSKDPKIGDRFEAKIENRNVQFIIDEMGDEKVKVHIVHPLEDKELYFKVKINAIRAATPIEIQMGTPRALPQPTQK